MSMLINVTDVEEAQALVANLAKDKEDYESFVHAIRSVANDVQALNATEGMNSTVHTLFSQIADALEPMIEPYAEAVQNLKNLADSAQRMEEARDNAVLGQVGLE